RLQVCLTDGNLLTAELLGAYRMSLLEGELTLSSAERLAGMTFSRTGSPGVVSRTISLGGGVTMEFVLIRPGSFMMGSEEGDDQEKPVHKVTITKPFYMGRYEVTQDQWQAVMGTNPSSSKGPKKPVEKITWDECQAYVRKLNEKVPGGQFGLPTEAQWEYACRAGSTTEYCYGQDTGGLVEYAWYSGNSSQSAHPVGEKKPNAWGLYDMHGNVWEWCQDWYAGYASGAQANPNGPNSGSSRVFRGGAFFGHAGLCRSAKRAGDSPGHRDFEVGVRLVRSLP
ncbi:MAG: formylglycine-generating enzyme family protein, partial [Planctomycetes bacterium]|nr:formylglycine-generating enzyme family protein [Planctomycetota bacterium]